MAGARSSWCRRCFPPTTISMSLSDSCNAIVEGHGRSACLRLHRSRKQSVRPTLTEALHQLHSAKCGVCRHEIGSASCFDEEAYERLGTLYAEAVEELIATEGPPLDPTPTFPGVHVD